MRGYKEYEFCKSVGCSALVDSKCKYDKTHCIHTAKEFHMWLNGNGFKIVKRIEYGN